jgi:ABC-2 type transport system permease protein
MDDLMRSSTDLRPAAGPSIRWVVSDSLVLAGRSIRHIRRNLDQLLGVAIQPIMFMVLFVFIFGGAIDTGNVSYVNYLTAGILIQTAAFGATTTAVSLKADLQRGIVDRFRSLPMFTPALLVGHITADLVRNLISAAILLVVAFVLGFRPNAGPTEWALALALLVLFTVALSWLSAIMGLLATSLEAVQWLSFLFIFPLTFVSSVFVPTGTMPDWLRLFAENQPVTHVVEAMRGWLVGTPVGDHGWLAFAWCAGIFVVAAPVATWLYQRGRN